MFCLKILPHSKILPQNWWLRIYFYQFSQLSRNILVKQCICINAITFQFAFSWLPLIYLPLGPYSLEQNSSSCSLNLLSIYYQAAFPLNFSFTVSCRSLTTSHPHYCCSIFYFPNLHNQPPWGAFVVRLNLIYT